MRKQPAKFDGKYSVDIETQQSKAEQKRIHEQTKHIKGNPCHVLIKELTRMDISNLDRT